MSDDLERLLRRAAEGLPEPDSSVTRRARARTVAAASRRRRRVPLAIAAALVAGCALGVALGTSVVSSGQAARSPLGFGFLPESGWNVLQSGGTPTPAQPVRAIAANVRLSPDDDAAGLPYATLLSLPAKGVVIVAESVALGEVAYGLHTPLRLPLRLRDATPVAYGVQVRPGRPLGQYELRGTVNDQQILVNVYFGSTRPGRSLLATTQRQLDRLVVAPRPLPADVAARALPLRQLGGGAARVIDRTLLCPTENSGGVREIELRVNTAYRQGRGPWRTLAFAVVASGGVRSVVNILDDSLAWMAAGKYDHNANLGPTEGGIVPINATRFGTWALNRGNCTSSRAQVPLSGKGLRAVAPEPLGVTFDCVAPRRVLVRVRVVAHAVPTRYREQQFEKTKASLREGFLAVRTQAGKQLAFASVFDSGRARLTVGSTCRED